MSSSVLSSIRPGWFFLLCSVVLLVWPARVWALPDGFVYVDEMVPGVSVDLRYATANNFLGTPVDGYDANRAAISEPAARALAQVQADLNRFGLGLKVFDAYRPQTAVNHFVRWAKDVADTQNKASYYPDVDKADLFDLDYIAERSGHSRGSTVDLTLISSDDGAELDMGSGFDFFGVESWPEYSDLTAQQRANRMLLQQVMTRHGFKPYPKEWWHFTLADEPYPDTYYDFLVR
ncbi:peptidase M15 [Orrella marina]|uniref:D-alanyl-D-alanine dipeptidase n=2 Tax=Orrella marina TaxID=2163011 RepID=A0A2R4XP09_9BURK|nr:peptidase M15 [Orrella marina]